MKEKQHRSCTLNYFFYRECSAINTIVTKSLEYKFCTVFVFKIERKLEVENWLTCLAIVVYKTI